MAIPSYAARAPRAPSMSAWTVCWIAASLAGGGCGGEANVAPIVGVVTLDGKPLAGASITTQPIASGDKNPGSGSFGKTDQEGRFELELVTPAMKGAVVGEHRVMISPPVAESAAREPTVNADGVQVWSDEPTSRKTLSSAYRNWPRQMSDGSLRIQVPPEGNQDLRLDVTR